MINPRTLFKITELIGPTPGIPGDTSRGGYIMSSYLRTRNPVWATWQGPGTRQGLGCCSKCNVSPGRI